MDVPFYDVLLSQLHADISPMLSDYAQAEGDALCVVPLCLQFVID